MTEFVYLYRVDDGWDCLNSRPILSRYRVARETLKCYVLDCFTFGRPKFILKDQEGRRWAYATVEKAVESYRRRKAMQISHGRSSIERAEAQLRLLDEKGVNEEWRGIQFA